jgi:hypothetical protein
MDMLSHLGYNQGGDREGETNEKNHSDEIK